MNKARLAASALNVCLMLWQIAPSIGLEFFYSTCDIKIAVNIFTTDEHR